MILRRFLHTDPVAISYLFGCGGHAVCAVVDPLGDIEPYMHVADETGMQIRFVVDTHIHADHRSGVLSQALRGPNMCYTPGPMWHSRSVPREMATDCHSAMSS